MHPSKTVALLGAFALVAACAKAQPPRTTPALGTGGDVGFVGDLELLTEPVPADAVEPVSETKDPSESALRVHPDWRDEPLEEAVRRGLAWLISRQGRDGAWGQDGGQPVAGLPGDRREPGGGAGGGFGGSAGVDLYGVAQAMEQLSRDGDSREKNGKLLSMAEARLADANFAASPAAWPAPPPQS